MPTKLKESDYSKEEWEKILKKRELGKKYHQQMKENPDYIEKRKISRDKYKKENKEILKKKNAEYYERVLVERRKNPECIKYRRIQSWKCWGIISNDWDLLHSKYLNTSKCDFCKREINEKNKCVDHDHDINDKDNVRGILCRSCNSQDKLKNIIK
mgnify:CR=1 FL=1